MTTGNGKNREAIFTVYGGLDFDKKKLKVVVTVIEEGEPSLKFEHSYPCTTRAEAAKLMAGFQNEAAAYLAKRGM